MHGAWGCKGTPPSKGRGLQPAARYSPLCACRCCGGQTAQRRCHPQELVDRLWQQQRLFSCVLEGLHVLLIACVPGCC